MDSRAGLALAYGMQRRHDEAIALHERIVAGYANKGPDDPVTLNLRNTLANNYLESAEDFAQPARLATAVALHERNRSGWLSVWAGPRRDVQQDFLQILTWRASMRKSGG